MQAQLQLVDQDGVVMTAVFPIDDPNRFLWFKVYANRNDACWDAEYLALLSSSAAAELKAAPKGNELPAFPAYVRNQKETLRTFHFHALTRLQ